MKPGAVVGMIDHVGGATATRATVAETVHRIDPETVKADFERAGFELISMRDFLQQPG